MDPGFRTQGIACVRVDLGAYKNDPEQIEGLVRALRQRALELPGVTDAAFAAAPPMEPEVAIMTRYRSPQGTVSLPGSLVGSNFFHLLGIPILEGEDFQEPTPDKGEAMINEALANKLWPGERAVGRMYGPWPVRGVVKDFAMFPGKGLHEPVVFLRMRGWARLPFLTLLVSTSQAPESLLPALRELPPSVALDAVVVRADSLRQHLASLQRPLQISLWLFGGCGAASLIIASIGLGSLINLQVTRSRREIGLRLVLGARSSSVILRTTMQGLRWASLGVGGGVFGAWALQRLLAHWYDSLNLTEPFTLFAASALMFVVSGLASFLPALQVVNMNPASLLKDE